MIAGRITGKSTTLEFEFMVEGIVKKFEYLQVPHAENDFVLCQVVELIKIGDTTTAQCNIIGYKKDGSINKIRIPFDPGTEVLKASDDFIRETINLGSKDCAKIGKLQGKDIEVFMDLRKALSKHISVLAKSGSGKSYCVGVILEELLEKRIPTLVIDPHGEYNTLKYPSQEPGAEPKSYIKQIQEYGDVSINPALKPLKLSYPSSTEELIHLLPAKPNPNQQALIYSSLRDANKDFNSIIYELEIQDNQSKWTVINMIDYLRKKDLFSSIPTLYNELIKPGACSIINLKGVDPEIQEVIVYKMMNDLFQARKQNTVPPFFAVIEEAHNYCPERGFGEAKSSKILRTIASEGRKFGFGLCVISQRPSRVDKSVLSQCSTQVILKVTNPNDLKAISASVEGMTSDTEKEIQNLAVGEAIVTGVVDMPLFVQIRKRKTKHGGEQVNIVQEEEKDIFDGVKEFESKDLLPTVLPRLSAQDIRLMNDSPVDVKTYLVPSVMLDCKDSTSEFRLLVDLVKGEIISDIDESVTFKLPNIKGLSATERQVLSVGKIMKSFTPADVMIKIGIEFARATNICEDLKKKGVLAFNEKYSIMPGLQIDLSRCQTHLKVEYKNIPHEAKIDKRIEIEEVKSKIKELVEIKDAVECFIAWHKVG